MGEARGGVFITFGLCHRRRFGSRTILLVNLPCNIDRVCRSCPHASGRGSFFITLAHAILAVASLGPKPAGMFSS